MSHEKVLGTGLILAAAVAGAGYGYAKRPLPEVPVDQPLKAYSPRTPETSTPSASPTPKPHHSSIKSTPKPSESDGVATVELVRATDTSVYWEDDQTYYASPWFPGYAGQIMIGFGCTPAPYYDADPSCPDGQGVHHGIDVYLNCGTSIISAVSGDVVSSKKPNAPGPAYGTDGLRIATTQGNEEVSIIIGHARNIAVQPGQHIEPGDKIAEVSDNGAPDGCHLHFEERPGLGSYTSAIDPSTLLNLQPAQ